MKELKPLHRALSETEIDEIAGGNVSGGTGPYATYDGSPYPREDYDVGGTWTWTS